MSSFGRREGVARLSSKTRAATAGGGSRGTSAAAARCSSAGTGGLICASARLAKASTSSSGPARSVEWNDSTNPFCQGPPRSDEAAARAGTAKEHRQGPRDELAPVVAANERRSAAGFDERFQRVPDPRGVQAGIDLQSKALPGELVDHREDLQPGPVEAGVEHEVHAPHVVRSSAESGTELPVRFLR
jgi:hypothetical protein